MSALTVTAAGPLSTIQDGGRWGHLRSGVTPAGAMDMIALVAANVMLGNPPTEAAIEFTLAGDSYELDAEGARIAVAGDAAITLNDAPIAGWRSLALKRGDRLRVGALRSGARGYLAIAGGTAIPPQVGSRSVHARSRLGGMPLRTGDRIPLARATASAGADVGLDPTALPYLPAPIRVVLGPQDDRFTAAGIATFLGGEFGVTAEADRMGYRLDGPEIEHRDGFNTISDATLTGSIQVPGTRRPIVLMADRQTTGGYPKIATTATASLPTLAQLKPGDR
ncbi:MAG: biotin-dependent carboxyltransferase family protein, partial [Alphaproteobacteria bacterium]|nr:biotin-dependent carboxyltransferase family protein [Alphaproteobacteria bacterium]